MKFLIVEEISGLSVYLKELITANKDSCYLIDSNEELISAYLKHQPDYVIIDIDLRKMNGFVLAEKLSEEFLNSKIIFISDFDDIRLQKRADKINSSIFIPKENLHKIYEIIDHSELHNKKRRNLL